jgi:hypothetical protein
MPEQTIADGLQRIIDAKTDIDGAIEAKDGTVTKGLENSDEDIMTIPEGATSYSPLTDKPAIDNHTLMPGNNTSSDLGLQTKLTFDSAPTENSTNPVTSGGVYTALSGKQATIDSSHKLSADNVDDTNATNKFATAAQLQQIDTNKTNISTLEKMNGQKNLLYVPSSVTVTDDYVGTPIVFTADSDEYVTSSPQADSRYFQYTSSQYKIDLSAGDYILYADIKTTVDSAAFKAVLLNTSDVTIVDFSMRNKTGVATAAFTIATSGSYGLLAKLFSGSCRFMILKKSIWDAGFTDYRPYAMSNAELTTAEKQNETNISTKIGASDYATQTTGGTVRVWTTTSGGETTLHISNEAP